MLVHGQKCGRLMGVPANDCKLLIDVPAKAGDLLQLVISRGP